MRYGYRQLWFTMVLVGISLLSYAIPLLENRFVYERDLVGSGEIWRLISGNWVHFSLDHLLYNLLIVGVCGVWLEIREPRGFRLLSLITMLGVGLYSYHFLPEMVQYGGLSGLATALVVYLALDELRADPPYKPVWLVLLVLVGGKVAFEAASGTALFVTATHSFEVVPAVHMVGVVMAVFMSLLRSSLFSGRPLVVRRYSSLEVTARRDVQTATGCKHAGD